MKKIGLLVLFAVSVITNLTFGQAGATTCAGIGAAATLTVNGACGTGTVSDATVTTNGYSCGGTISREWWYTFTIGATTNIVITGLGNNRNIALQLLSGTCGSLAEVACDNTTNSSGPDTETIIANGLAAGTYFVKVLNLTNNDLTLTSLCITGSAVSAPANATCASATALPCGTTALAGTTVGTSNIVHGTGCSLINNYGVWYSFVGDGQVTTITTNPAFDIKLSVSIGSCASLTNIVCTDASPETATFTTVSGTTYFVYVSGYGSGSTTGTFTISRTCCAPPTTSNAGPDQTLANCATSATLAGNTPTVGVGTWTCQSGCTGVTITSPSSANTTVTGLSNGTSTFRWQIATASCGNSNDNVAIIAACPPSNYTCATATNLACASGTINGTTIGTSSIAHGTGCSDINNYGVWYTFVGDGQSTTITTSSSFDIKMSIATGSCGSFTNIVCTDSSPETATFTTVSGTTYYVYIAGYSFGGTGTTTGNFTISRTCCTAPTTSNAGSDINVANCVTTATLAGNTITTGTGVWSLISGTATITSPSSPNSGVTGLAANGSATLRWTSSNAGCSSTTDDVVIFTVCPPPNMTCATATNLACASGTINGTTIGTSPVANVTGCINQNNYGVWYTFVGDGQSTTITTNPSFDIKLSVATGSCGSLSNIICLDSSPETATFTTVSGTTYYVYVAGYSFGGTGTTTGNFTISRTCCTASTIAAAGSDIVNNNSTTATLAGNTATVGTGTWTKISGPGTISSPSSPTSAVAGLTCGTTTVFRWTITNACSTTFDEVSVSNICGGPANQVCASAINLPCGTTNLAGTTVGTSDLTNGQSCSMSNYGVWYTFIGDGNLNTITVTGAIDTEMSISSSPTACGTLTNITCQDVFSGSETYSFVTTIGLNYYVYVAYYSSFSTTTGTFTISRDCISCATSLGSNNVNLTPTDFPYSVAGHTTTGAGDNLTAGNMNACGDDSYFSGEDKLYIFTPTTSGNITVTLNSGSQGSSVKLFSGCPFTGTCVAFSENTGSGVRTFCVGVTAGTTYYLSVDSYSLYVSSIPSYTLDITAPSAGQSNDLPCNAITITNGSSVAGNNECTSATSETGTPSCWTGGTINSVWYKFQATSTSMYLQTTLGTMPSTQIAVYTGACASLTQVSGMCNEDAPASGCSGSATQNSILDMTTLSVGTWYYVRVDGDNNDQGSFNLILNDGTSVTTNDPILGQDCLNPVPICSNIVTVPNPSYAGTGNICDFTSTNNCTGGEKNSVWYTFEIATTGSLNYTIYPNDATNNSNGAETDYDWVLWKIGNADGTSNTSCATLNAAAPVSCNYGTPGITGVSPGGTAPSPINSYFDGVFEPTVAVTAGERYVLVVQNFETTASGFDLNFSTSTAGAIDATPSTIFWTGSANTSFTNVANYGTCAVAPACGINVVISAAPNQPLITGTTTYCRDLTINAGATLTMAASSTLYICGNLTNFGTIICPISSTIVFVDGSNTTQTITGNFSANGTSNKFGNLTVTKAAGSVIMNSNINVGGTFTTSNATSIFNINGRYMKVAGNFYNNAGNTTFTGTGTASTVEFNGIGSQNYNQGSSDLDLNFVKINNTGGIINGVQLQTDMNIKATTGTLDLTLGTITTTGTSTTSGFKVFVKNTTPACVTTGNVNSFVLGNLRRNVTTSGDYNWPVGNAAMGYERARTIFSVTAGMAYIDSRFDAWPMACTQAGTECGVTWDQATQNNGFWTMIPNAGTCTYDCTLYSLGATNTTGMSAWTIIKREHTSAIANDLWLLNGTCAASTVNQVTRTGMTNFSFLGVDQSLTPLPIELTSFSGKNEEVYNVLEWSTASERDNDYFTLEKSNNGYDFTFLAEIDGAGNSTVEQNYSAIDNNPFVDITYYRLKQTDFNGLETYSSTISISNILGDAYVSNLYPNPTTQNVSFDFSSPSQGSIYVNIYDIEGRMISTSNYSVNKGSNNIDLEMLNLAKGIYNIEVKFDKINYINHQRVIKQ